MKRRDVLKLSSAAAAAGMTGLAGCSAVPFVGGGGGTSLGDAGDWLPDPTLLSGDAENYNTIGVTSPAAMDEVSSYLSSDVWESYQSQNVDREVTNLAASEIDLIVNTGAFSVLEGEINRENVESTLREDYSREGSEGGYELYVGNGSGYAVSDTALISARSFSGESQNTLTQVIDAANGDVDLYTDVNSDAPQLFDALPGGQWAYGSVYTREQGSFEGDVAAGISYNIGEEESTITTVYVFVEDITEGDRRDINDNMESSSQYDNYREGPELNVDGNVATIEGTILTRDVTLF